MYPPITAERDYTVVCVVAIQQSHSVVDLVKVRTWYVLLAIIVKHFVCDDHAHSQTSWMRCLQQITAGGLPGELALVLCVG